MALTITVAAVQSMGDALATAIGSGATIQIRTGPKPATPETAAAGTLLATVSIVGSFTSTDGVLTSADPASASIVADGTAAHFRLLTSGAVAILDGTVTAEGGGGDMELGTVFLSSGATLDLGVPTIAVPTA